MGKAKGGLTMFTEEKDYSLKSRDCTRHPFQDLKGVLEGAETILIKSLESEVFCTIRYIRRYLR